MTPGHLGPSRWPELGTGLLLVVPTGSCEQHGPHLPLDTDTLIAVSLAEGLAARRPDAVVAPALAIGASGEHQGFPGTLSIGTPAMTTCAVEIARSALPEPGSGRPRPFAAVLFVNGHGGNVEALGAAVELLVSESRAVAAWHPRVPGGDPHAGMTETSLMLHLHPGRVRMDLAEPGSRHRFRDVVAQAGADGLAALTPNGVLGDPTGATAARGAELYEHLLADLGSAAGSLHPGPDRP